MCSDIEMFINLIFMTNVMNKLHDENFKEYLKCVKQTQDWEKFKDVDEIIKLDNIYIYNAIKEILSNQRFIKKIKEDTNINIDKLKS